MARRIEIELTSARPDGTWTWRAAGALNPRGTLDGSLLYDAAKTGDVVRAEAEFGIDGITVVAVEPPRPPEAADPNRIELIDRPTNAAVTTQLVGGRGRPGPDGGPDRRRGDHASQPRGRSSQRPTPTGPAGGARHPESNGNGSGSGGPESHGSLTAGSPGSRTERPARPDRTARPPRPGGGPGRGGPRGPGTSSREAHGEAGAERATGPRGDSAQGAQRRPSGPRQKRLNPGNAHRNAMLESLPVEQRPIAQQLLRGGIPAVRTALHFERERAREEGRPEPSTEGVLALAESLVSRVKAAEWRDRAEAAIKLGDDLAMRDLRSLVSGSDAARDEASRDLVVTLREMLERRVEAHRTAWSDEVAKNLDEGHVVRALRLSSRPPDPAARFSAELATRLRDAASAAMAPSTPEAQWLAVLQGVVESPVRRTVKPEGLPANPSPELLETARQHCGRVPALAPLLGISVPPPPGPVRPNVPTRPPSRSHTRPSRPRRGARTGAPANGPTREPAVPTDATADGPADEPAHQAEEPRSSEQAVAPADEPAAEAVLPDQNGTPVAEPTTEAGPSEQKGEEPITAETAEARSSEQTGTLPITETMAEAPSFEQTGAAPITDPTTEAGPPEQSGTEPITDSTAEAGTVADGPVTPADEVGVAPGSGGGQPEPLAFDGEGTEAAQEPPATEVTSAAGASLANEP